MYIESQRYLSKGEYLFIYGVVKMEETQDYYVCSDERFNDKKTIRSFHEWEQIYYNMFYPLRNRETKAMFNEFIEWHYIYLHFRYTK